MNVLFVSLGCDKNLVDSEHMLGNLFDAGYTICDDENIADIIVINTCSFIEDAMTESISTIIEFGKYKEIGQLKALIVTGCLAQRYHEQFFDELPEVDAIIGTNSIDELVSTIEKVLQNKNTIETENRKETVIKPLTGLPQFSKRIVTTGGHYAYLKIAEGCSKRCTYCVIPSIRGNYRSYPMSEIIEEAQKLVSDGVKELILVAQETTVYGLDLYKEKKLPELINKLSEINGVEWIRILYAYPEEITEELIQCIATNPKVCHYIDMPIQHCNDQVLKAMGRKTDKMDIVNIICRLRTAIPDICIRTTLITGFPGETQAAHQEMMNFVEGIKFDRLGVFPYSQEEDTVAASMDNQLDENTKHEWVEEIMQLQKDVVFDTNSTIVGDRLKVFIEGELPEEHIYVGRTYRDTPGVDGLIFVKSDNYTLTSGQFVDVEVTAFLEYDLIGEIIDEFTK